MIRISTRGKSESGLIVLAFSEIVLGLDDTAVAVRLVRLILADPLSPKAEWEEHLENYHLHDAQGLIIRLASYSSFQRGHCANRRPQDTEYRRKLR